MVGVNDDLSLNLSQVIEVPEDAELGKVRIRIRYAEKNIILSGAEDDVWGMVYDFVFYVVETAEKEGRASIYLTVPSNRLF